MPHPINGLKELTLNPVLASATPGPGVLAKLYAVPGAPFDTEVNVLRVCNAGDDAHFWVGFATQAQPTVVYAEFQTEICANGSLDVFEAQPWLPPTTQIWVQSDNGLCSFVLLGSEVFSAVGDSVSQRTGS